MGYNASMIYASMQLSMHGRKVAVLDSGTRILRGPRNFGGAVIRQVLTISVGPWFAGSSLQLSRWEELGAAGDNAYLCRINQNHFIYE